jgi:hypothetical protein
VLWCVGAVWTHRAVVSEQDLPTMVHEVILNLQK